MKKLILAILTIFTLPINAQMHRSGHIDPDSLNQITVSGTVSVEETSTHFLYYLDENSDGSLDYHLNFGPYWYNPDSSSAERPLNGDVITVSGVVHNSYDISKQTIIVYEIDGQFWRDPYFAEWNNLGYHSHQIGGHHGGMLGYGFGWDHAAISNIEISGTLFVDTTFFMNHYQLDIDGDKDPDYQLNFGPFWYEPESNIKLPMDGENITITGGLLENSGSLSMIIVYEINGEIWIDSSSLGTHFGGGWFHAEMVDSQSFHSPFDSLDHVTIREGWHRGSHGNMGGMLNFDSLFCQILEVYPENIPNLNNPQNIFAGYEIHMFYPTGQSGMRNGGMMGGHMQFGSNVEVQLHYTDKQLEYYNVDENSIKAKYWNNQENIWVNTNFELNTTSNTVVFENNIISNFIVLEYSNLTSLNDPNSKLPSQFQLAQNYPNPFNPSTTIKFSLPSESFVSLKVYNVLGKEISTLVNEVKSGGNHSVELNAENLSSGIYFYKLETDNFEKTKKMILLK